MSEVANAPVAPAKSAKDLNKERLEKLKAAKAAGATAKAAGATGEPKAKREKKVKEPKPCKCGCGGQTTAFFVPGHDARFKGWLLKVEKGATAVKDLPETVQKSYKWVKKGKGYIPTTNYKGEPHAGYLTEEETAEVASEKSPS